MEILSTVQYMQIARVFGVKMHTSLFLRHTTQLSTNANSSTKCKDKVSLFTLKKTLVKQQQDMLLLLVCREQMWEAHPRNPNPSNEVSELQIQCLAIRDASEQ